MCKINNKRFDTQNLDIKVQHAQSLCNVWTQD